VSRARKLSAASVRQTGSSTVAAAMIEKLFYHSSDPNKKSIVAEVHDVISRTDPEAIASGQLAMSTRPDATGDLPTIEIPSLFVVGAHDEITTPAEMRHNAELVPGSTFLEISAAGHLAPLENPFEFNRGLIGFLNR
jgi:pimeloyl-ACP methyl ester carboxylesterase